jgi:hypothetical protein
MSKECFMLAGWQMTDDKKMERGEKKRESGNRRGAKKFHVLRKNEFIDCKMTANSC